MSFDATCTGSLSFEVVCESNYEETSGGGPAGGSGGANSGGSGNSSSNDSTDTPPSRCMTTQGHTSTTCPDEESTGGPAVITSVSVSEIASVAPAAVTLQMEPAGWALVGKPANFWVDAAPQSAGMSLLGNAITVNFTPVALRLNFGDGTSLDADSLGGSWQELGLNDLSDTATSHRFTTRGNFAVSASVLYSAQAVLPDGRVLPVQGLIAGQASSITLRAYTQSSYLVPNGP